MNKTILMVVIILVVGVFGFILIRHFSRVSAMRTEPATYQNNTTTPNTSSTTSTTTPQTDLSKTNLDTSLKGLDSQAAGIDVSSDDLNF